MPTNKKIKVAIVVNTVLHGGAERIVLDLARGLGSRFDMVVIAMKSDAAYGKNEQQTFRAQIERSGVRVINVSEDLHSGFRDLYRLHKILRSERPDIVHTFLPFAGTMGRIAARLAGVSAVISTQCNVRVAYGFWGYWSDRLTLPFARAWTGAAECIEIEYGGTVAYMSEEAWKQGRRHFTIPAGVDVETIQRAIQNIDRAAKRREIGVPEGAVMVMMTARLVSWKGHEDLIRAMALLPERVHAFVAGGGDPEGVIAAYAREKGVSERMHFLGSRSDVYELLGAADIYVQSFTRNADGRLWMGPCTAQMEACAAGVPSISTRVPLIEYLIRDGETGKLAELNDPQSLADAILWMTEHPAEAQRLGKAGEEAVRERYTLERMVSSYESLYGSVIAK